MKKFPYFLITYQCTHTKNVKIIYNNDFSNDSGNKSIAYSDYSFPIPSILKIE